jgi:hypothetical protein
LSKLMLHCFCNTKGTIRHPAKVLLDPRIHGHTINRIYTTSLADKWNGLEGLPEIDFDYYMTSAMRQSEQRISKVMPIHNKFRTS